MKTKRNIPVVTRMYLADGSFLTNISSASKPGSKKMQFPYEIPEIKTSNDITISDGAGKVLITVASIFALGLIGRAVLSPRNK